LMLPQGAPLFEAQRRSPSRASPVVCRPGRLLLPRHPHPCWNASCAVPSLRRRCLLLQSPMRRQLTRRAQPPHRRQVFSSVGLPWCQQDDGNGRGEFRVEGF
jgi:hypothetical protein